MNSKYSNDHWQKRVCQQFIAWNTLTTNICWVIAINEFVETHPVDNLLTAKKKKKDKQMKEVFIVLSLIFVAQHHTLEIQRVTTGPPVSAVLALILMLFTRLLAKWFPQS